MALTEIIGGLSLAGKVLLGTGVATASLTGAGAAGVLPSPIQDGVAGVVSTVTPFELPARGDDAVTPAGTSEGTSQDDAGPETDAEPATDADFGVSVAERARDGGVDGEVISDEAREMAAERAQAGLDTAAGTPAGTRVPSSLPEGPATDADPEGAAGDAGSSSGPAVEPPVDVPAPVDLGVPPVGGRP